ncbi:MAG: hypothetical protein WBN04_05565 [Paracoccaceae bacterium]
MKPLRPLFLARHGYRRRRIMDAARVLPVLGAFLFFVPLLWTGESGGEASTRVGVVYLFAIWLGLIVAALFLSLYLRHDIANPDPSPDEDAG